MEREKFNHLTCHHHLGSRGQNRYTIKTCRHLIPFVITEHNTCLQCMHSIQLKAVKTAHWLPSFQAYTFKLCICITIEHEHQFFFQIVQERVSGKKINVSGLSVEFHLFHTYLDLQCSVSHLYHIDIFLWLLLAPMAIVIVLYVWPAICSVTSPSVLSSICLFVLNNAATITL